MCFLFLNRLDDGLGRWGWGRWPFATLMGQEGERHAKDIDILIQEEICNFMTQLMYFMHDGYITAFTTLINGVQTLEPQKYSA